MKSHSEALESFQKATEVDVAKAVSHYLKAERHIERNDQHTREIETNMQKVLMEMQSERSGETDEQTFERYANSLNF